MSINFKEYLQKAKDFWSAQEKKKKILYTSAASGILVLLAVSMMALKGTKSGSTLYKDLSASEANRVVNKLRNVGISAEIDGGNVIVPKNEVSKAEMQLSMDGYTRTPYSYNIFKEGNSLLSSDSEKRAYMLFELQNRLESAIVTMEGIEDAMVTIALPESNSFVLGDGNEDKPSASVKLTISGLNPKITGEQVKGIKTQVARSVPGLEVERVAVLDNYGNVLESSDESTRNNENDFMKMKDRVDSDIRSKVLSLLVPIFGKDNVKVTANSVLNYDDRKTKETIFTPVVGDDKGIIQHREEIKVSEDTGSSQTADVGMVEENAEESTYPEQSNQKESSSKSKSDVSEDYLVNKKEEQIIKNTPTVETLSVAVAVNRKTMSEQEKSNVRRLTATAAGIAEDRVELCNMEFTNITGLDKTMTVGEFFKTPLGIVVLVLSSLIILLLLILLVLLLRSRARNKNKLEQPVEEQEMNLKEFVNSAPSENESKTEKPEEIIKHDDEAVAQDLLEQEEQLRMQENNNIFNDVVKFVDENSETASQLIKSWIRNEESMGNG